MQSVVNKKPEGLEQLSPRMQSVVVAIANNKPEGLEHAPRMKSAGNFKKTVGGLQSVICGNPIGRIFLNIDFNYSLGVF